MGCPAGGTPASLCVPSGQLSCAACCGLYNVADATRHALASRLAARSARFRAAPRTIQGLIAFEEHTRRCEQLQARDADIHLCEFCGFLDGAQLQVGCLLHPRGPGNAGYDWRGLCHYGALACTSFFCPACSSLSAVELELLRAVIDSWHLWGLVATDLDFVRCSLQLVERALGQPLTPALLLAQPTWRRGWQQLLAWKDTWPAAADQTLRCSRYHCHPQLTPSSLAALSVEQLVDQLTGYLAASFELAASPPSARDLVDHALEVFRRAGA